MPSQIDPGKLRWDAVQAILERKSGHVMSSLSASDLVAVCLNWLWSAGERTTSTSATFILSKGHAAPALYAGLAQLDDSLEFHGQSLRRIDAPFGGHPRADSVPSVVASTGSLGVGIAFAVGAALGDPDRRLVVVASDGELQEGVSWEALRVAARFRLRNLLVMVDANGWQTSAAIPRNEKFVGAMGLQGVESAEIDGHDVSGIGAALGNWEGTRPRLLHARTNRLRYVPSIASPDEVYGDRLSDTTKEALIHDLRIPAPGVGAL